MRRLSGALVALGVVLCTSLMVGGPSAAMDMDSMTESISMASGVIVGSDTVVSLGCEGTCAVETTIACATAVVASIAMFLLVGARRSRMTSLAPRQALERALRTAGVEQPPWGVLSPTDLCLMRV